MAFLSKKSEQKLARHNRLIDEIISYLSISPKSKSVDIVHYLSNERRMKNYGLTPRKIGMFITSHCKEKITFEETSDGRTYFLKTTLENVVESDD
ncbi:MAG: hypothetical protein QF460_01110 [Candidatus Nanoarchaeia archaeon]|jgi:hypothetical protein|nr:hypothetical protein [Candidatus Nanoarchaeia archaeon]|tara:strand:- start:284 stop:568 length:285 start_codon:yes stop_codon:yes gene_type:complete